MASKSSIRHTIYNAIAEIARPGDVCFFITEDPDCYQKISWSERMYRKWMGFADGDISVWHLGILSKFEKKPKSSQVRPYIIHATEEEGVFEQHIFPEYFTSKDMGQGSAVSRTIMEIVRNDSLTDQHNEQLVDFCRLQIGKPFPKSIRGEGLTYIFGLPNLFVPPGQYSCHSLVYAAFDRVGVNFPHHLEAAPFFNLGKYLGHPLGHRREKVNPKYPYLRDHHLYQDPRFKSILTLTYAQYSQEIFISRYPPKFSWNPRLAAIYNVGGNDHG
jgi:hypothetical protein